MAYCSFGYGPPLLPDELLYSWLGRFALLNALGSSRDCVDRIFGSRTVVPIIDLPTNLQSIRYRLGDWLPLQTFDQLIDLGTLLPYHRPFLNDVRYKAIREILIHGGGKGLKALMGRVANRFGANPALRSCAMCIAESITRYGSPYWLRLHQLPGVTCCTRHGIQLQFHSALHLRTNRQKFLVVPHKAPANSHIAASDSQRRFAALSQELLMSALPALDPKLRAAVYRRATHDMGLGSRLGRTDYEGLAEAIRKSFTDFRGFAHRERLLTSKSRPLAWIKDLIERPGRATHPICHLLLIDFLFGSIASFSKASSEYQSKPDTPIFFTQPATPAKAQAHSNADYELLLYDISFSCRQVAMLIGKSVTTVVALRRARSIVIRERRKTVTQNCIDLLLSKLRCGHSPKEVATHCKVSLSTVYRIRSLYIHPSSSPDFVTTFRDLTEHRRRWQQALSMKKVGGVNEVRAADPAAYAWLYRHDREWLMSSTQTVRKQRTSGPRMDWIQRDAASCDQVRELAIALRQQVPPRRITKTQLLRPLGETMFQKNKGQFPLLTTLLNQICDTQESFGIRRVDYAIATIARSKSCIKLWRVKRIAGLRLWPDAVNDYAIQEIERINSQSIERIDGIP